MAIPDRVELGTFGEAARGCEIAPGRERAPLKLGVETRGDARDREHVLASIQIGCGGPEHPRVRVPRLVVERLGRPLLHDPAGVHDGRVRAGLRDDRKVVRHEDERKAELVREVGEELEGPALAPSRRAQSSARRRGAHAVSRRAPSRSQRAGACRPTARAGSSSRAPAGCLRFRTARGREQWPRPPLAVPCSSIGSTIWSPIRLTGSNAFMAPWKTIAMSFQRCGATVCSPRSRTSMPSKSTRPETEAVGGSSPISARTVVVFPHPDSPTMPRRVPASTEKDTPCTACSCRPFGRSNQTWRSSTFEQRGAHDGCWGCGRCGRSTGRSTRKRRTERWPVRRRGLSASSIVCPMMVQERTTSITQMPGG